MPTNPFFNDRNRQIFAQACDGISFTNIGLNFNLSNVRIGQIVKKVLHVFKCSFWHCNRKFSKKYNYIILPVVFGYNIYDYKKHCKYNSVILKKLADLILHNDNAGHSESEETYLTIKTYQENELLNVNDEWIKITKEILFGKSLTEASKEYLYPEEKICKIVKCTCYTLNPDFVESSISSYDNCLDVDYFISHKRAYFDKIELEIFDPVNLALLQKMENSLASV